MKDCFFNNIAHEILMTEKYDTRINMEWIVPDAIGVLENRFDDKVDGHITSHQRRKYLIEIVKAVSENTGHKWSSILKAFLEN